MKVFINENIKTNGDSWIPKDREEFEKNIYQLLECLRCFNFFNESEIYFNSEGIKNLIDELEVINQCLEYSLFDPISHLREFIKHSDAIDWQQSKTHRDDQNYLVLLHSYNFYDVKGSSLAEASEYFYNGQKVVILNFCSSIFNSYQKIYINRAEINPPQKVVLNEINSISNKNETISYFLKHRENIEYSHNPKHGENHNVVKTINGEIISPLECTQVQAVNFLKLSIGNKNSKDLFAYDGVKKRFLRFKDENTTPKKYHAFYPHDQNIPPEVKYFLEENKELFKNS